MQETPVELVPYERFMAARATNAAVGRLVAAIASIASQTGSERTFRLSGEDLRRLDTISALHGNLTGTATLRLLLERDETERVHQQHRVELLVERLRRLLGVTLDPSEIDCGFSMGRDVAYAVVGGETYLDKDELRSRPVWRERVLEDGARELTKVKPNQGGIPA